MAKETDQWYRDEEVLVEMPKGRDTMKVIIGHKMLRGELKTYLDIRMWYVDDDGILRPGRGFAKPLTKTEMELVGKAILDYAAKM
jgi:hypothetical protein